MEHVKMDAGDYTLYTENTPGNKAGWHRVIIVHRPTGTRKMDSGYLAKTEAEYRELFREVLTRVGESDPRTRLDTWPKSIQKRFPVMMEHEVTYWEAAKAALSQLA